MWGNKNKDEIIIAQEDKQGVSTLISSKEYIIIIIPLLFVGIYYSF
jgi:hypothetical protein